MIFFNKFLYTINVRERKKNKFDQKNFLAVPSPYTTGLEKTSLINKTSGFTAFGGHGTGASFVILFNSLINLVQNLLLHSNSRQRTKIQVSEEHQRAPYDCRSLFPFKNTEK